MPNLSVTLLTSAWAANKYLNQYLLGLSQLKEVSGELDITVAFGSISDIYTEADHQLIKEKLESQCVKSGVKLHYYSGKSENYSETIANLIAQTISSTENYAINNLDDFREPSTLLAQAKTLQTEQITYSDYVTTNNVIAVLNNKVNGTSLEGVNLTIEPTYESVDMTNKERYFREFRWGPFPCWKASLNARLGVYSAEYRSSSDFDWFNRLIFHNITPVRTPGIGGYFLNNLTGLSTKPDTAGHRESYHILERFLGNKHCCILNYSKKILWRNLT